MKRIHDSARESLRPNKMNVIKSKWLHLFLQHGAKGRFFILLSVSGCMLSLVSVVLLLSALDFSKGLQILLGCLLLCIGLLASVGGWNKARHQIRTVPLGWGAEIMTMKGKRVLVSRDERGTWVKDETDEAGKHFMGDQVKLHDLRNRALYLSHYSTASDGAGVSVMASIVWSIDDLRDYLCLSQSPVSILEDALHRHLTNHITRTPSIDLTRNTEQLEWAIKRKAALLTRYGLRINDVHVISIEILAHVSSSPPQAEPKVALHVSAPQ